MVYFKGEVRMKEYLISLKECTPEEIWDTIRIIKPKTIKMEIVSVFVPIFLITIDDNSLKLIENLPQIKSIETNDRMGIWNNSNPKLDRVSIVKENSRKLLRLFDRL
jgi:hypothetical protein